MPITKRSYEGEIFLDHRASPGLSEHSARMLGYDPQHVAEGKLFEAPTYKCNHCGSMVLINPDRKRDREYCSKCDSYICDNCGLQRKLAGYEHITHIEKLLKGVI